MNKTAELVGLWAAYEAKHPKAGLKDFCRTYLAEQEEAGAPGFWMSPVPPDGISLLTKLMGRIAKLHSIYAVTAFKECGINSFDEFLYLNSIGSTQELRKTEAITANFNELSSGLLIIDRLIKAKLVAEQPDKDDKRSKRLQITQKGLQVLESCYAKLAEINQQCFGGLSEEQVKLCTQLLQPVELFLAEKWLEGKKKQVIK